MLNKSFAVATQINKWLIGEHNFTLRSLGKLEAELGDTTINVPHTKSIVSIEGKRYITAYKNTHC